MTLRLISMMLFLLVSGPIDARADETAGIAGIPVNPLSLSGLRELANSPSVSFRDEFDRPPIGEIQRRVVSFVADGLRQYALVLEPGGDTPDGGWPVLLMNHGHHPDPPQYGRIESGETDRPGDYYRALPLAFAERGFLVVVPDFRGHNDSEGIEHASGLLESFWYARDSIVAFGAIDSLPGASAEYRFMWGHSMGGSVTQRALLALGGRVTGASIWSSMTTDARKNMWYYSLRESGLADLSSPQKPLLEALLSEVDALPFDFTLEQGDAGRFIDELETPLAIHHSIEEIQVTPINWSIELAGTLHDAGKPFQFYSYPGDKHLFEGENLEQATERDVSFFKHLAGTGRTD